MSPFNKQNFIKTLKSLTIDNIEIAEKINSLSEEQLLRLCFSDPRDDTVSTRLTNFGLLIVDYLKYFKDIKKSEIKLDKKILNGKEILYIHKLSVVYNISGDVITIFFDDNDSEECCFIFNLILLDGSIGRLIDNQ